MIGEGLHLGVIEYSAALIFLLMFTLLAVKLTSLLCLDIPHRQVQKSSQPLFLVEPGPAGFVLLAVVIWPVPLLKHEFLSWPSLNTPPPEIGGA